MSSSPLATRTLPRLPDPLTTMAAGGQRRTGDLMADNIIEDGGFRYESLQEWAKVPDAEGWDFIEVSGVAVDSKDNVYVMNRGQHPIIVFDSAGNFLRSWGEGEFDQRAHGICASPD